MEPALRFFANAPSNDPSVLKIKERIQNISDKIICYGTSQSEVQQLKGQRDLLRELIGED